MKQAQILAAFNITKRFQEQILPNDISYAFFKLRKLIQDPIDFQVSQQDKLLEKYDYTKNEQGQIVFKTTEDAEAFSKEMDEIIAMDIDLGEFKKIPFKNDGRIDLSMNDLIILDDFFEYE
jgi:hypothetical protein